MKRSIADPSFAEPTERQLISQEGLSMTSSLNIGGKKMKQKISDQVTTLLYCKMTLEELDSLPLEELQYFAGMLYHWHELTTARIQQQTRTSPSEPDS